MSYDSPRTCRALSLPPSRGHIGEHSSQKGKRTNETNVRSRSHERNKFRVPALDSSGVPGKKESKSHKRFSSVRSNEFGCDRNRRANSPLFALARRAVENKSLCARCTLLKMTSYERRSAEPSGDGVGVSNAQKFNSKNKYFVVTRIVIESTRTAGKSRCRSRAIISSFPSPFAGFIVSAR